MSNGINYYEVLQLAGIEIIKTTTGPEKRPALWFRFEPHPDRRPGLLEDGEHDIKVSVDELLAVLQNGSRLLDAGLSLAARGAIQRLQIERDIAVEDAKKAKG